MVEVKRLPRVEAMEVVLTGIAAGKKIEPLMASVGRTAMTYKTWRKEDADFARRVDEIRAQQSGRGIRNGRKSANGKEPDGEIKVPAKGRFEISFEQFRKQFLHQETYDHHRAWIAAIENNDVPEDLPGEWVQGRSNRILIGTPPFHSKSTVISIEYVVYRICMNPNIRIAIISKTQNMAKTFLHAIKQRLTDPRWAAMQAAYAPEGGFKPESGEGEWSATRFYVAGIDSDQKDPTCQALGIGNQIYGARLDLAILDDVADVNNFGEYEKQIRYLEQDVSSRLYGGKIIVVGTRVGTQDLYSELLNPDRYISGKSPWSYLKQPAVLSFAEDEKDWKTLWPKSNRPMDENADIEPDSEGMYPAWDGEALANVRGSISPQRWALVYQQMASSSESVFDPACVWGSVDRRRKPGALHNGGWGHPVNNENFYVVAGLDPAVVGDAAIVVMAIDKSTQKRYVLNAFVSPGSTEWIRNMVKQVTEDYRVNEWKVEANAFQLFLVHDPELRQYMASRGVKWLGQYTGSWNKLDNDFGISSISALFGSTRRHVEGGRPVFNNDNLISLPDPDQSNGVKLLIEQLLVWVPGKRGTQLKMDAVMALWFAEIGAREILGMGGGNTQGFVTSRFMSRRRALEQRGERSSLDRGAQHWFRQQLGR